MGKKIIVFLLVVAFGLLPVYGCSKQQTDKYPTPSAPILTSTLDSIIVQLIDGAEYKIEDNNWQEENIFTDLESNTEYTVYMRIKAQDGKNASDIVSATITTKNEYINPAIDINVGIDVQKTIIEENKKNISSVSIFNLNEENKNNLFDENDSTYYMSDLIDTENMASLQFDLNDKPSDSNSHIASGIKYIDRIDIYPYIEEDAVKFFPENFDIEISADGVNYTVIASRVDYDTPTDAITIRFAAQSTRYIKINITKANNDKVAFSEIIPYFDFWYSQGSIDAEDGATYYVSNEGDDANSGISPEYPFKTLNRVNSLILNPGNKIYLKKGDIFIGESLMPTGNGTQENPIVISNYGEGENPVIIAGKGMAHGIRLFNNDYYTIDGIDFSDSVTGVNAVSYFKNTDENYSIFEAVKGLIIKNCNFDKMQGNVIIYPSTPVSMRYPDMYFGAGINIVGYSNTSTKNTAVYDGITIENCNFNECDTGIINTLNDMESSYENLNYFDTARPCEAHRNFNTRSLLNLNIKDVNITKSIRSGGIMLYGAYDGCIDNAFIDETGIIGMPWGVAACQISMSEDFTVKKSLFQRTYLRNNSVDGEGFDFESGNINVTLKDSTIKDCEGPAILTYGKNLGWKGTNYNCVVDNCVLENNGIQNTNDHSKVFKDYPDSNEGGIVKNTTITLAYEGQGFLPGYKVDGEVLGGVYNQDNDKTLFGLDFDFETNIVKNPDGVIVAGVGFDENNYYNIVSYNKAWTVDKPQNVYDNNEMVKDTQFEIWYKYNIEQLSDGELSGNYNYNSGFSTKPMPGENIFITLTVDLEEIKEINTLKMFGLGKFPNWLVGSQSCMLPKDFYFEVSNDGVNYTKATIIGHNDGSVVDFDANGIAVNTFQFMVEEARYFRIVITKANENPAVAGEFAIQIAELQLFNLQ